jgi:glycosyltransferase involved in cell wall biosynthesis
VLHHTANQGVGGATLTGFRQAQADGADIVVKLDGDGQMDPALIPALVRPIVEERADYAKGNRFFELEDLAAMPRLRLFGNALLSLVNKAASGYWDVMDPTNGFVAIRTLGDDAITRMLREQHLQPLARERLVVGDEHAQIGDHTDASASSCTTAARRSGRRISTSVPPSAGDASRSEPFLPYSSARR